MEADLPPGVIPWMMRGMRGARVGRLAELWRHPVKSMRGERIERAVLLPGVGIPGDRAWAVRDERGGEIRGAKQIPRLLEGSARCQAEPRPGEVPRVEIALPDGRRLVAGEPAADAALGDWLERPVRLWSQRSASDLAAHRRARPASQWGEDEVRRQYGLLRDEPLPEISALAPAGLDEYVALPGTWFDSLELHLLTDASLRRLAELVPGCQVDVRRFRPNLVLETDARVAGTPEIDWCGRELAVGKARLQVVMPMVRCVMTTHAQADLEKAPQIMRALVKETGHSLGVALRVLRGGAVAVGDSVELL